MIIKKYFHFLIIPFLIALNSCESVIEFNAKESKQMLVVNSFLNPNDTVAVQVSLSRFFLSSKKDFTLINDAQVDLFVNEKMITTLKNWGQGTYSSSYQPKPGEVVKIVVTTLQNGTAYSVSRIPDEIKIESAQHDSLFIESSEYQGEYNGFQDLLKINSQFVIVDDPKQDNYYRIITNHLTVYNKDITTTVKTPNYDYFTLMNILTPVDEGNTNILGSEMYRGTYFKDDFFKGKSYTIKFENIIQVGLDSLPQKVDSIRIETTVESLSSDYYQFLLTKDRYFSESGPFSEPVQIKSNVVGGLGILGTSSIYKFSRTFTVMPTYKRRY
jgi:Domain of unknown function (DUF4249)